MKKSPHSWNRRGFTIAPNGYFTVLKATQWFPAMRLPGGFRYVTGQSNKSLPDGAVQNPTANRVADDGGAQEAAMMARIMALDTRDRHGMRPVLIVLAAAALTAGMLSWIYWFSHP